MRRGLASLVIGISLAIASVAWAGVAMLNTLLDPDQSRALAEAIIDNPTANRALRARLAASLAQRVPPDIPVSSQVVQHAAERALAQPEVRAATIDAIAAAHGQAMAGDEGSVVVMDHDLSAAGRAALVAERPTLDDSLPDYPAVRLELPTTGLHWLGSLAPRVKRFTIIAAILASAGIGSALVLGTDRPSVLRRAAVWAFGSSAFWLILSIGLPRVAIALAPTSTGLASAGVDIFSTSMVQPATMMACAGAAALIISLLIPAVERRQGAARAQAATPSPKAEANNHSEPVAWAVPLDSPAMSQRQLQAVSPRGPADR